MENILCLRLNAVPDIDSIFLGVHQTGWIIDSNGIIRFVKGVTSKTPGGVGKPWEVKCPLILKLYNLNFI